MPSQNHFDAIALLKADHRKVEELFDEFEAAKGAAKKQAQAHGLQMSRIPPRAPFPNGIARGRRCRLRSKFAADLYGAFPVKRLFWVVLRVFCSERERPFFVPSPAIRSPERAEGVKGPKRQRSLAACRLASLVFRSLDP